MTDKTISHRGIIGDCFILLYDRKSKKDLKLYLNQFDINDYWIYKNSNKQFNIDIKDFYNFKYAGYIFFLKELYNKDYIDIWIVYLHSISKSNFYYLVKPFPNFNPEDKIVIKK